MSKIHIIYNPNKQDILGRLARALHDGTGWNISKTPDTTADINYYMLYISYAQSPYNKTKVAAWFSHQDIDIPKKMDWWDIAANGVDIRTTTAQMYHDKLSEIGETHLVMPPVDKQFFDDRPFRIGLSGFVHPAGRKGESLAFRLHKELPLDWRLSASGRGWQNISHKEYRWQDLPEFYRSLDVFLCTSLIEGVPMPPIEALAANVPIVIPYAVGMLDTIGLEERQGVFRYHAGYYDGMMRALERAHKRWIWKSNYAGQYSIKRWADDHKRAFGLLDKPIEVIADISQIIPKSNPSHSIGLIAEPEVIEHVLDDTPYPHVITPKQGRKAITGACVVYIAYGAPAREMAQIAMNTWRDNMAEPIVLISDEALGIEDVFIEHPDTDIGARSVKTKLYDLVPAKYKTILYLDADTEILGDVSFLFKLLTDGFDFAICCNPPKYYSIWEHKRPDNEPETQETINLIGAKDMLLFNGGVFVLKRNIRTKTFMQTWHEEWQRYGARDQMGLLRALYANPMKVQFLTQSWNTIIRYVEPLITSGILHHPQSARRWTGQIDGRLDSDGAWEKVRLHEGTKAKVKQGEPKTKIIVLKDGSSMHVIEDEPK